MTRLLKVISIELCILFMIINVFLNNGIVVMNDEFHSKRNVSNITQESYSINTVDVENNLCYLVFNTERTHFLPNENIVISYNVSSKENVQEYIYSQSGFTVISITKNNCYIDIELSCIQNSEEYKFDISVELENGTYINASIYAINNEYGTFISTFSLDNAIERYCEYAIQNNILTEEEVIKLFLEKYKGTAEENVFIEYTSTNIPMTADTTAAGEETIIYCGYLSWRDDSNQNHPLRRVKVEIYNDENIIPTLLGTSFTDNNGYFEFNIPTETDTFFRIYAGDSNIMVKRGILGIDYLYESEVSYGKPAGTTATYHSTFSMDDDLGKAFQISQAIITARDYAWVMMGEMPESVSVFYPHDGEVEETYDITNDNGCFYNTLSKTINITGRHPNASSEPHYLPHSYASWDVLMHEYGHHIQNELDLTDSPAGGHFVNIDMAEHYKNHYINGQFNSCPAGVDCVIKNDLNIPSLLVMENDCKYKGAALAWAEAWATIFGIMAQEYYATHLEKIDFVNDARYTSYNGVDLSLCMRGGNLTECVEQNIQSFVYDLYDDDSDIESFDQICFSHEMIWNYYVDSKAKTLYDFVEYIKSHIAYRYQLSDLGKLLNEYNLSANAPELSGVSFDCPVVEFIWNEPNITGFYKARKFKVDFYDSSYNIVGSTEPMVVLPDDFGIRKISISESLWQAVLNLDSTFYISVTMFEHDGNVENQGQNYFITKYESQYTQYDLSNLYQRIYYSSAITETLDEGEFYWFKFIAPSTEEFVFETIGATDTYGELFSDLAFGTSATNIVACDDDGGDNRNFKITYCMNKGDVVYLRVRGYNWIRTGDFTISISVNNHIHDYTQSYERFSSNFHKAYCFCGEYSLLSHEYFLKMGILTCKHCGYSVSGDTPVLKD